MKKALITFSACCMALTSAAVTPMPVDNLRPPFGELSILNSLSDYCKKLPPHLNSVEDVLYSVEGTSQDVIITGSGYVLSWDGLGVYVDNAEASHVVYGDNSEVYFRCPVIQSYLNSYIKGIKEGDKIVIDLPQNVAWYNETAWSEAYGVNINLFHYVEEDDGTAWYYENEGSCSLTFTVGKDGTMTTTDLDSKVILGLGYTNEGWSGYGMTDITVIPFNEKSVEVPENIEVSENFWSLIEGYTGWRVNFAQDGDELYFQGIWQNMPDAWMKAYVEYDGYIATVTIPQNQYVGPYGYSYVYTGCANHSVDEMGYDVFEVVPESQGYELIWDFEKETLTAKDPDMAFVLKSGGKKSSVLYYIENIYMRHQNSFAGIPMAPPHMRYEDRMSLGSPYNTLLLDVPSLSTEGTLLDTTNLYYVVYVDGDMWEFEDVEGWAGPEAPTITEIPWSFSSFGYHIMDFGAAFRVIDFFEEGISTLGVQSIYYYEGEKYCSEITEISVDNSSIKEIDDDKEIYEISYYDINGYPVANPTSGIFVRRIVYSDGTVIMDKIMR